MTADKLWTKTQAPLGAHLSEGDYMGNYILRNADPELWQAFRARALAEGHSLRWLILELVKRYVREGL